MATKTVYEWIREEIDEYGDIVNTDHFETRQAALNGAQPGDAVGLTRDVYDDCDGLVERLWAYLKPDGTLPACFSDSRGAELPGYPVPKRFVARVPK